MASTHISNRFQFEQIVASIFRMINENSFYKELNPFIKPKLFYINDTSEEIDALRTVLTVMDMLHKEGSTERFSPRYVESQIPIKIVSQEKSQKILQKRKMML